MTFSMLGLFLLMWVPSTISYLVGLAEDIKDDDPPMVIFMIGMYLGISAAVMILLAAGMMEGAT